MTQLKKRYFRFFLYNLIAFIPLFLGLRVWHGDHTISALQKTLSTDIWEILLMSMVNGFNKGEQLLNGPLWTVGPMLFVEFLILGIMVWLEKPFLMLVMPVSVIAGMGYMMNTASGNHLAWLGLFTYGTLRVYLLTCFGIFSYWLSQHIRKYQFNIVGKWCLTILELSGYLWCVLAAYYLSGREYQFCFILVVTIILAITLSGKSKTTEWIPQTKVTDFCAEWSLALYMTHWTGGFFINVLFRHIYPAGDAGSTMWQKKYVAWTIAAVLSLGYLFVMRGIFWLVPRFRAKLKTLLLKEE